ncbi:MAG: large conductance mechanosensitive channel protein MscL [Oscillospiraceae bacterium]|nr:large conductance mechanosensitive channel protein MscL [Oscillospiraceae bacterium]
MKKFIEEFKAFIMRGNVVDMAVGVIIATAFGKITTSLINDVFMPFISFVTGSRDMTALNLVVRPEIVNEAGEVTQAAITIGFGTFLATIIDFILIAFVVFLIVKSFNKAREVAEARKKKEEEEAAPPAPAGPTTEELLQQILDELKNNK